MGPIHSLIITTATANRMSERRCLVLGASYGSLMAAKLLHAGHNVTLVGRDEEVRLINREGIRVHLPLRDGGEFVLDSRGARGAISACVPEDVRPGQFDLAILALSEPQYAAPEIASLLMRIGAARIPCLSLMNMPPLAFLRRLLGADAEALADVYTDPEVWATISSQSMSMCSPDPQAFRPTPNAPNVLRVTLATNFKAAPFADPVHTTLLRELAADIDSSSRRDSSAGGRVPVRLVVGETVYAPLAKWPMLIAGNYRCLLDDGIRSIADAVHEDVRRSEDLYSEVSRLCLELGASEDELVPFARYAEAAEGLTLPAAVARALLGGAVAVERVDRLLLRILEQRGQSSTGLSEIVERVDRWVARNRAEVLS